ncbi:MAG: phosphoribosylaminoimidazolesuccinocarboxamide synthase, partial [Actinomycetes bacterium]
MSDVSEQGAGLDVDAQHLPGWRRAYSGKVRDLYVPEDASDLASAHSVLMVASDRVSAFDHVLEPGIPGKGALLTQLTRWWFDRLGFPTHLDPVQDVPAEVADRAVIARRLDMHPVECVVRGYLSGSGWAEYQQSQSVCGIPLPAGLTDGDRLPEPIYTPAYKAPLGEHDENVSYEHVARAVGADTAAELRRLTLAVYGRAAETAASRGVIVADTKLEFGRDRDGRLVL